MSEEDQCSTSRPHFLTPRPPSRRICGRVGVQPLPSYPSKTCPTLVLESFSADPERQNRNEACFTGKEIGSSDPETGVLTKAQKLRPRRGLFEKWTQFHCLPKLLLGLALCLILCPPCTLGRKWTTAELRSQRFPYQSSNDLNMDVCKSAGFLGDIALNEWEMDHLQRVNQTMKRLDRKKTEGEKEVKKELRHLWRDLRRVEVGKGPGRRRRAATARKERIWDNGVIPYEIQSNFSGEHKTLFRKAMRHWENHTCLVFVERSPEDENYIVFTVAECGCCSFVGKRGDGAQAISIGKNCDKFGIVVHELGHVVGFWHEHTRPDRDQFVDIYYKNIQQGQDYNFEKLKAEDVNSLGEPYDFASIMHYARDTFARAMYMDTILPKPNPTTRERPEIGQRIRLSPGDIRQANALYSCPQSGATALSPKGVLSLPQGKGKRGIRSQWRVVGTHGEKIHLNISALRFPAPSALHCDDEKENFLAVRDGHYLRSRLIAKFCTEIIVPVSLRSSGNRLWIEYRSSPKEVKRHLDPVDKDLPQGLDPSQQVPLPPLSAPKLIASYEVECGGEISADEGVLESPGYPDPYRPDQDCTWLITVPENYQVALKFEVFEVELHQECIYDRLEIWDGHEEDSELIDKLCGNSIPINLKSTGNQMRIHWYSDNSVDKTGFHLEFVKEFDECKTGNHGCQHKCVNTLGGFKCDCDIGYELHIDGKTCEDACGGYIKAENGTLTSPNFPQLYPPSKRCIWEIEAHPQFRITLNFTHFDMEGNNRNCEYDFVKVTSVSADGGVGKLHGSYCGSLNPPFVLTSQTHRLRIEFSSDTSVQKSGFAAFFFTDRDECDIKNGGCEQVCRNTIGSFRCECQNGFVLAEDGRHCKEGGCKFEVNAPNGQVSSPNFPNEYPNSKDCVWHFVTTPGHRLKLTFNEFEVEPHVDCRYDKVELFDGSSPGAEQLGLHCGTQLPGPIISSNNQLFMLFATDGSVARTGFSAEYVSECGGKLEAERVVGFIYSHAKYGGSDYDHKMSCEWIVEAPQGWAVELKFTAFSLEEEGQCEYDNVRIFDGPDPSASHLGRYCDVKLPPTFISTGRVLRLEFHTDDTVERKGFIAEYRLVEPVEGLVYTTTPSTTRIPNREPVINERDKYHG